MVDSVLEVQNIKTTGITPQKDIVTTDSGTGDVTVKGNVVVPDSGTIGSASDTDAITIDSSGNVGIGTDSPQSNLDVASSTGGTLTLKSTDTSIIAADEVMGQIQFYSSDASGGNSGVFAKIDAASNRIFDGDNASGMDLRFFAGNKGDGAGSPPERMRILSSGVVELKNGPGIKYTGIGATNKIAFKWGGSTLYGRIDDVLDVAVGSASDYRLKSNIKDYESSLEKVLNLRPITYNPKINFESGDFDETRVEIGLIAHEVAEIFPSLVTGEKDGTNGEGIPEYQSVHYAGLTPILVKALQEQQALIESQQSQIDALTARIEALENAAG